MLTFVSFGISEIAKSGRCNAMWAVSVPQLNCSAPVVALALASLGAALEAKMLSQSATAPANMVSKMRPNVGSYVIFVRFICRHGLRFEPPSVTFHIYDRDTVKR